LKGFKKDGKFRPTEKRYTKNSLTKKSLDKKSLSSPSGGGHEMREKKQMMKEVWLQGSNGYWSMLRNEDGTWDLSLDNKISWRWDGDGDDLFGFLIRVGKGGTKQDFIDKAKGNLEFSEIKSDVIKKLDHPDAMYEISGDNNLWNGSEAGEMIDIDAEIEYVKDDYGLTDEQAEELSSDVWGNFDYSFEGFMEYRGKGLLDDVKKIVNNSNSFEELFDELDSEEFWYDKQEPVREYIDNQFAGAMNQTIKELGFDKKK
jgi:hypothetical protein